MNKKEFRTYFIIWIIIALLTLVSSYYAYYEIADKILIRSENFDKNTVINWSNIVINILIVSIVYILMISVIRKIKRY